MLARALAVITELTLLGSGAAAFFTVLPRVNSSETDSDIAWMSKGFLGPAAGFIDRCKTEITLDRLQADQLNHLHILARICRAKYRDLRLALWLIPARDWRSWSAASCCRCWLCAEGRDQPPSGPFI